MSVGRALPGVILLLAACVLLALVSFNTPLLKSFYFLEGRFSSGTYAGNIRLGSLGYCVQPSTGGETCTGPQVGYSFDLNAILGLPDRLIDIPASISKYLTYALVLHIVALGCAAVALVMLALEMIPGFNMLCFPTCAASIAGSVALIAFVFDLAIFYIAKAAIDKATGASASIGAAVWMTLAAWLCCAFSVCAIGMGNCCCGGCRNDRDRDRDRKSRRERDRELDDYRRDDDMRMQAIRDENRRQKEQGLPDFERYERMPLTNNTEDKYLYDDSPGLQRNGSAVTGVGVGYGRRGQVPTLTYGGGDYLSAGAPPQRRPSVQSSVVGFGQAGVGAGGAGVDQPQHNYNDYDPNGGYNQGGTEQFADNNNYYDPYQNNPDPYANDPYAHGTPTYPPVAAAAVTSPPHHNQQDYFNTNAPQSSDSHNYQDPGPRVQHAHQDPYYEDDGLGAIGRAAQSPTGERQYTGSQGYSGATIAPLAIPTPQRLAQPQGTITSPESEYPSEPSMYVSDRGQSHYNNFEQGVEQTNRPPSYGAVTTPEVSGNRYAAAAPTSYPPEKTGR